MFTKVLLGLISVAVGSCVGVAAPAGAEDENPFGTLTCNCRQTVPPGSSALSEINRGLQHARSAEPAGPPAPIGRG